MTASNKDAEGPCNLDYIRQYVAPFNYPLEKMSDMTEEMRAECKEIVVNAIEKHEDSYELAAKHIKEQMDKKYGASWHCVIGEGFGFEITYEMKHMMYMFHKGYVLPRTVAEWIGVLRGALQLSLDELPIPEHFYLRRLDTGNRFLPMQMKTTYLQKKRDSAVLVLLSPPPVSAGYEFQELCITLTKRTTKLRRHKGQMSFPGGAVDAGETKVAAAQRETLEEVGINASAYTVLGPLHPIISLDGDSCVHPFLAISNSPVSPICQSPNEVTSIHYLHISRLLLHGDQTHYRLLKYKSYSSPVATHFPCFFASNSQVTYCNDARPSQNVEPLAEDKGLSPLLPVDFPGELVWGLTAFVLCELLIRLSKGLAQTYPCNLKKKDLLRCSPLIARDPDAPLGRL
ncbi:NUDIX hydrolase domain [Trypanosoma melophagium]|uniref:NUDIX hydrolase domain n=1 Tax=Trypanosoma melophagium TaxID=715481 RepID=UPI003519DAE5|nr:NUDIX hydrolase domain [Trypanosoma melophagium]